MGAPLVTEPQLGSSFPMERLSSRSSSNPATSGPKTVTVKPLRFWLFSVGIYLGLFTSMMDVSIIATSLHTIAIDYGVFLSVNWIALAYTLAECSCGVVVARLSDIIGRRNAWLISQGLFLAFSIGCGFSKTLNQLIAFRTLQGIGGSGLYALAMVILPEVCPNAHLEFMCGLAGVTIVAACLIGPVLGGVITNYISWRWIFWINGPLCVIATVFFLVFWPEEKDSVRPARQPWRRFDYIGSLLLIAATVIITFSFQNVGVSVGNVWHKAIFIAPVTIGILCLIALITWEYTIGRRSEAGQNTFQPVFPLDIFRNRPFASGALQTLFLAFPLFISTFSVPLRAQIVSGLSVIQASLMLLPMLAATSGGCVAVVLLNFKKNFLFETMLFGACVTCVGCSLLTTVQGPEDDNKIRGYLVLLGFGAGLGTASATGITGLEIPLHNYAPAQAIIAQARVLGGSFGIATISVLLHNQIISLVPGNASPEFLGRLGDPNANLPAPIQKLVEQGCIAAFRSGMIVSAAFAGAAALASFIAYSTTHQNTLQQRLDLIQAEYADPKVKSEESG